MHLADEADHNLKRRDRFVKNLIIVGASGFGRELLQWVRDINRTALRWNILGFLDDDSHVLDGKNCSCSIIGSIQDYQIHEDDYFAIAVAKPKTKERIVRQLESRGAQFATIIHPRAKIADSAKYGKGFVIYPDATLGPDTLIGDYVTLLNSGIGHDASIGDFSTISSLCDITGGVEIGKRVFIASHATIIPQMKIGDDAYVGAGSVVIRNVRPNTKVFGNPAKIMDL